MTEVTLRFYGPLNDFLPKKQRQLAFTVRFCGTRSVKDAIEGAGVPHPEIELVLRDGEPVPFDATVRNGDRIAVFPRLKTIDISSVENVRPHPLEMVRFVLDGHLGKLARRLRLVGLDAACPAGADDNTLAGIAARASRILLTRDRELLKRRIVTHGYFVRETEPDRQLIEVLQRYGPPVLEPFSRCLRCNGELRDVSKSSVEATLPPKTREHYERFQICGDCGRVYWQGAHWRRLLRAVDGALHESPGHVGSRYSPECSDGR
jgi:hypothetical protein